MWIERCMTIQGRRDVSEQLTTWWEQVIVSAQVTFSHSLENHFMGFWWSGQSGCSVPQNSSHSGTVHDSERLICVTLGLYPQNMQENLSLSTWVTMVKGWYSECHFSSHLSQHNDQSQEMGKSLKKNEGGREGTKEKPYAIIWALY